MPRNFFYQRLDKRKIISFVCLVFFLLIPLAAPGELAVKPGLHSLDTDGKMQISPEDRCPVCGMIVAKHQKFASAIELVDHTTYYFCGTGCMIRTWMHPEIFLIVSKSKLKRPVVRDYFTGREMDAREALWVAGSDIIGPMGPALVPLKGEKDLKVFMQRHGGKKQFRLHELNDDSWYAITGKKAGK